MPKKLGSMLTLPNYKDDLIALCKKKGLNDYETELIVRIYWYKQSLNYISYHMNFGVYGKPQDYYSVRSINNMHKEAFLKLIM